MKRTIAMIITALAVMLAPVAANACVIHSDLTLTLAIGAGGDFAVPSTGGGANKDLLERFGGTKSVENAWLEPVGNLKQLAEFSKLDIVMSTGHPILQYQAVEGATPGSLTIRVYACY